MERARWTYVTRTRPRGPLTLLLVSLIGCNPESPTDPPLAAAVTLSQTTLSFSSLGETHQLAATVTAQNGAELSSTSVAWTSSESSVASVSSTGLVKGVASGTATICVGDTTALSATGAITYAWDNGAGLGSPVDVTPSSTTTYTVTGTDGNACENTAQVTVTVNNLPIIAAGGTATICVGDSTSLTASGASTYLWDNGAGAGSPVIVSPTVTTTFTVTGTDGNGCENTGQVTVTVNPLPVVDSVSYTPPSSCVVNDAMISIYASGGTAPLKYSIDNGSNYFSNSVFTGLGTGVYSIDVSDTNGCTVSDGFLVITVAGAPVASISTQNDPLCANSCDGNATATLTGGMSPFTYLWDGNTGGQTTATADSLCAGIFSVTITDSIGCSDSILTSVLTDPILLTVTVSTIQSYCGMSNGSATATPSGGTGTYTYQWDSNAGNQLTATANGLVAGIYYVTVTDTNGCMDTALAVVSTSGPLPPVITKVDPTCNAGCDGQITVTQSGGFPPFSYQWDDPATQTNATATGMCSGIYTVTVTDDSLCVMMASGILTDPPALTGTISSNPASALGCTGDATVTPSDTTGIMYQWDAAANNQTTAIAINLCVGSYCVTITDMNNCTWDTCTSVTTGLDIVDGLGYTYTVYPNPNRGLFNLTIESSVTHLVRFTICNYLGQEVYNEPIVQFDKSYTVEIDLRGYSDGVYNLQIVSEMGIVNKKMIIEK